MTTSRLTKLYALSITILAMSGCSTTNEADLDLPIEAPALTDEQKRDAYKKEQQSAVLQGIAVMNWQNQFMGAPNSEQRAQLVAKLERWTDLNSSKDYLEKARSQQALGQWDASEASLRAALRLDSNNTEAMIDLISIYCHKKNLSRAFEMLSTLKMSIEKMPRPDDTLKFRYRYMLSLVLLSNGERSRGHEILSDLISLRPDFIPAFTALANSYMSSQRWELAEFITKRALDKAPNDAVALNLLGSCFAKKGLFNQAREYFSQAIKQSPTLVPALINRASISFRQSEYQAAELDLEQALAIDGSSTKAMLVMGSIYTRTGRIKSAQSVLSKALELNPEDANVRYQLAMLYSEHLNNETTALRYLAEIQQIEGASDELKALASLELSKIKERGKNSD